MQVYFCKLKEKKVYFQKIFLSNGPKNTASWSIHALYTWYHFQLKLASLKTFDNNILLVVVNTANRIDSACDW